LQETFIKTYKNLNGFNQSLTFSSWIYRIARNEALNYLKKHKNKHLSLEAEDHENIALINILASNEDIQLKVSNKETAARVREVLNLLRDDYREVLVLKYLEDYDYNEISAILKRPTGTVGVLISRAKEAFKQLAEKNNLYEHEQSK
jgi:RNA polymerase sigma-70 factor (ECF subfamily)